LLNVDLQSLVGRLNAHCRSSLEGAVGLTLSRTHYNVEIEHWLMKLVETTDNDVAAILRHFEIDMGRLSADLTKVLDRLKTGNSRSPALTPNVVKWVREAWIYGSLQYGDTSIRSGYLIVSLLGDDALSALARDASPQFARINAEALKTSLLKIVSSSSEAGQSASGSSKAASPSGGAAPASSPTGTQGGSALDQYTINLTARAREGKIDPVLGRDSETRQIVDILTRRRQNNPILTGEAGVGKTAVVEGFALKIAAGEVPTALKDVELLSLDLGLLQAGAGMKGEFENRLKKVIEEVKASAKPIIMFIDEAHTLIGAGGAAGQNDAANLLKPALARGEMRTIAATTWAEYKKYFERDPALTRRFQVVKVEEPDDVAAIAMMRGLIPTLERHHGVRVLAEAVEDAVRLSRRYIPSRQLPDKAVSLLDTACGRVAIAANAIPAAVEDRRRRVEMIDVDLGVLARETKIGADHATRMSDLGEERVRVSEELAKLEDQWKREQDLVSRIRALHDTLTAPEETPAGEKSPDEMRTELAALTGELEALQGETPLMRVTVDSQAIAEVVGNWTGIPVGRMVSNEIKTILALNDKLRERVIGQSHALEAIAETIRTSRAKLLDPRKPIGVFRNGAGARRPALWRRTEPDRHQHVGVQGRA
jgi:type VI secretion system protein VasG